MIRTPKVLVTGWITLDTITGPKSCNRSVLGGGGAHSSLSSSFLAPTALVSTVGYDFPNSYFKLFTRKGIDSSGVAVTDQKTTRWEGKYNKDLNKVTVTKVEFTDYETPVIPDHLRDLPFIYLAPTRPINQIEYLSQMTNLRLSMLDTFFGDTVLYKDELKRTIGLVGIATMNRFEANSLCKTTDAFEAAKRIHQLGPKYVIIKMGSDGALLYDGETKVTVPTYTTDVVDPIGAGDSFGGGVISYLSLQNNINVETLFKALVWGTTMASFNLEGLGSSKLFNLKHDRILERFSEMCRRTGLDF